jgi:hypothetical protein
MLQGGAAGVTVFEKRARSALCQRAAEEAPMLQERRQSIRTESVLLIALLSQHCLVRHYLGVTPLA